MGRTRHGRRSAAALERRKLQWIARGGLEKAEKALAQNTTTVKITVAEYPKHFVKAPISAKNVTKKIAKLFPRLVPRDLPSVTEEGRFLVPTPPSILASNPPHPPHLIGRFDRIIKENVEHSLMAAWDEFAKLGVRFLKADPHRSKTPALHLGVWELYASRPRITGDSRKQKADVIKIMDRFLYLVHSSIAPKIFNILRSHYPAQFGRQILAFNRIMVTLADELANRPALAFGGAFFTVAVKEGSSELVHLDFNDDPNGITWIVPIGDWEGGEFCVPQLGMKIPIRSGQILGAMTRVLAHCSAPVKGRRVILTLFADKTLLKHSS